MKYIKPVDIQIDTNMDADDLGQRIVDCVRSCNTDLNFLNVVKVDFGDDHVPYDTLSRTMMNLNQMLKECGASNCMLVPIGEKLLIKNITIDHIEVVTDDTDERTEKTDH